jgi:hypothetical protein
LEVSNSLSITVNFSLSCSMTLAERSVVGVEVVALTVMVMVQRNGEHGKESVTYIGFGFAIASFGTIPHRSHKLATIPVDHNPWLCKTQK